MNSSRKIKHFRRRFVTLIEMMIVMFLIALITGVVAYNYRGSLEEGKAFKTKAGIERLQTILSLALAENPGADLSNWQDLIKGSPLVQNADALLTDGWGQPYQVGISSTTGNITVTSARYNEYRSTHANSMFK